METVTTNCDYWRQWHRTLTAEHNDDKLTVEDSDNGLSLLNTMTTNFDCWRQWRRTLTAENWRQTVTVQDDDSILSLMKTMTTDRDSWKVTTDSHCGNDDDKLQLFKTMTTYCHSWKQWRPAVSTQWRQIVTVDPNDDKLWLLTAVFWQWGQSCDC